MGGAPHQGAHLSVALHLRELTRRTTIVVLAVLLGSIVAYYYRQPLLSLVINPLHQDVFYTTPAGAFDFTLNLCLLVGLIFAFPVLIYHVVRFIEPALPAPLGQRIYRVTAASYLLAFAGGVFAYYLTLPAALNFLGSFTNAQVRPLISADTYFTFVLIYLFGFAFVFQLPLIMLLVNHFRRFNFKELFDFERWVILISFVVGMVVNPAPDPLNQSLTAIPLIIMYQISFVAVMIANRRTKKAA